MSYELGYMMKKTDASRLFKLLGREDAAYYFEDYGCGRFVRYIGNSRSHNIDTQVSKDEYIICYEGSDSIMKACFLTKDEYELAINIMKSKPYGRRDY